MTTNWRLTNSPSHPLPQVEHSELHAESFPRELFTVSSIRQVLALVWSRHSQIVWNLTFTVKWLQQCNNVWHSVDGKQNSNMWWLHRISNLPTKDNVRIDGSYFEDRNADRHIFSHWTSIVWVWLHRRHTTQQTQTNRVSVVHNRNIPLWTSITATQPWQTISHHVLMPGAVSELNIKFV